VLHKKLPFRKRPHTVQISKKKP
jgi:hypothetical protein